jgi:hypothetical protein
MAFFEATPLDWIAAVPGVGVGTVLTLLLNDNKDKNLASA